MCQWCVYAKEDYGEKYWQEIKLECTRKNRLKLAKEILNFTSVFLCCQLTYFVANSCLDDKGFRRNIFIHTQN